VSRARVTRDELAELVAAKCTVADIAERLGYSVNGIHLALARHGLRAAAAQRGRPRKGAAQIVQVWARMTDDEVTRARAAATAAGMTLAAWLRAAAMAALD
jgi:hypothetical protein